MNENIPPIPDSYFWYVAFGALFALTAWLVVFLLNRFIKVNDSNWTEVRSGLKELNKGIGELITVAKLHEQRIATSEQDIKDIQGDRIVRYTKRNGK